ncbi:hypothetical protein N8J30_003478 [Salmonella enterica subsp. enterica serovar Newport]|nr:hypothetical protein [Salmonella enterica subsp. enterica serovar Newport]EJW0496380.1 hypothetical protein [Salmonella enterica subsp. enterica serovar Newport]ELA5318112.1 hypothetical protein [Salmonella enterica subsp. enterica serovar Newport]
MPNKTVTVPDVLKEAGKATTQEITAKLDIDQIDTLKILRDEMDAGVVAFEDGRWSLVNVNNVNISASVDADVNIDTIPAPAPAPAPTPTPTPTPVDQNIIFRALQQNGAMTAAALAKLVNRKPQGMAAVMIGMAGRGLVVKNGQGEGCTWSLPPTNVNDGADADTGDVADTGAGAGGSIPAFPGADADTDDFVFRLLTRGTQERQRAREYAARLDEVCDALSVLHKYPDLIQQLSKGEQK